MTKRIRSMLGQPSTEVFKEEAKLLKAVVDYFEPQRRDGVLLMKIRDRYTRGYSDVFFCVKGVFVVAELKDDKGKPSVEQLQFIEDVIAAGGIGGVCRTVAEVAELIEQAKWRQADKWQT